MCPVRVLCVVCLLFTHWFENYQQQPHGLHSNHTTLQIKDKSFSFKYDTSDLSQVSISNKLVKIVVFLNPTPVETLCIYQGESSK